MMTSLAFLAIGFPPCGHISPLQWFYCKDLLFGIERDSDLRKYQCYIPNEFCTQIPKAAVLYHMCILYVICMSRCVSLGAFNDAHLVCSPSSLAHEFLGTLVFQERTYLSHLSQGQLSLS